MKYNKNLINDLFEIKEKLDDEDKAVVERFIEQYNKMYVEYREIQNDKNNAKKLYNENSNLKEKMDNYKAKIIELENKLILGG